MMNVFAKIIAKNPVSIGITLGAIGLLFNMPNAGTIFWASCVLQVLWLVLMSR